MEGLSGYTSSSSEDGPEKGPKTAPKKATSIMETNQEELQATFDRNHSTSPRDGIVTKRPHPDTGSPTKLASPVSPKRGRSTESADQQETGRRSMSSPGHDTSESSRHAGPLVDEFGRDLRSARRRSTSPPIQDDDGSRKGRRDSSDGAPRSRRYSPDRRSSERERRSPERRSSAQDSPERDAKYGRHSKSPERDSSNEKTTERRPDRERKRSSSRERRYSRDGDRDRRDRDRDRGSRDRDRDRNRGGGGRDRDRNYDRRRDDRYRNERERRDSRDRYRDDPRDRRWRDRYRRSRSPVKSTPVVKVPVVPTRAPTSEEVQAKLAAHAEQMKQKAQIAAQAINMPTYLNPSVVNPQMYAQQQEKKKLLWGGKKKETSSATGQWTAASADMDPKFRRLMGIKEDDTPKVPENPADGQPKQESELLHNLEIEFERSRAFQLSRGAGGKSGIGLGYTGPKYQ